MVVSGNSPTVNVACLCSKQNHANRGAYCGWIVAVVALKGYSNDPFAFHQLVGLEEHDH